MYTFSNWTDEIAEVSEQYQNAEVELLDPSLVTYGPFDPVTNKRTSTGDPLVWEGFARIIPPRWGVNRQGSDTGNASTQTSVLIQFPKKAFGRVKRGMKLTVVTCEDNPGLETMLFKVTSGLQGSNAASRTVEFAVDGDVEADDA